MTCFALLILVLVAFVPTTIFAVGFAVAAPED